MRKDNRAQRKIIEEQKRTIPQQMDKWEDLNRDGWLNREGDTFWFKFVCVCVLGELTQDSEFQSHTLHKDKVDYRGLNFFLFCRCGETHKKMGLIIVGWCWRCLLGCEQDSGGVCIRAGWWPFRCAEMTDSHGETVSKP